MGRAPCCEKVGLKRGRWTVEEDEILMKYIQANGEGSWRSLPKNAGLLRCGKSCRLRWINYLRADLKRGNISAEEEEMIIKLHTSLGNRWSLIAGHLPGRTDNEIKNYWNSHLSRRIHTFRRPISTNIQNIESSSATQQKLVMELAKINTSGPVPIIKRKGGRISRASMKKKKILIPSSKNHKLMIPTLIQEKKTHEPEEDGGGGFEEKRSLIVAIEDQVEERESLKTLGVCQDEERESMILYPNMNSNEEIESGLLCTFGDDHVHEPGLLLCHNKFGGDERENGVSSGFDDQGGKISGENLQFSSSTCFDQENGWNWNWEGGSDDQLINVWGEKEEEMLSWLWEENDNDIGGGLGFGSGGNETLFKEQALNAWLLS